MVCSPLRRGFSLFVQSKKIMQIIDIVLQFLGCFVVFCFFEFSKPLLL